MGVMACPIFVKEFKKASHAGGRRCVLNRLFLGTKRVNAFRQRIVGPQRFKTRLGNQSAIKRSS
jgi:hypothetical protein